MESAQTDIDEAMGVNLKSSQGPPEDKVVVPVVAI